MNPATGKVVATVAACEAEDVDLAVRAARCAFESGVWSEMAPADRKRIMLEIAALIRRHADELAVLDSLDVGKLVTEAHGDVEEAALLFQWYGEALDKVYDEVAPSPPNVRATVTHEPVGVVGAVTAWNYPLHNATVKLAPALAAGNSVVLKPAEQSSLSALRLAELCAEAGLPDGVLNVVPGFGETAGKAIGLHPDIDCVGFTGSTEVGKLFLRYAADSNMKRVWLECGGKSPNIVFADCEDLDRAVDYTIGGIFTNAGQVCSAHSRLLVQESIRGGFMARLVERAAAIRPGDPLDPSASLGAIIDERQLRRILDYIEEGKRTARLLCGGKQAWVGGAGCFVEATIFDDVAPDSRLAQEEIFGPVLAVMSFDDEDQAVALANDTIYGLAASVWTGSLGRAHRLARRIRAGTVSVNTVDAVSPQTPFGGYKQSGLGRDYSVHGMHQYMAMKTSWITY